MLWFPVRFLAMTMINYHFSFTLSNMLDPAVKMIINDFLKLSNMLDPVIKTVTDHFLKLFNMLDPAIKTTNYHFSFTPSNMLDPTIKLIVNHFLKLSNMLDPVIKTVTDHFLKLSNMLDLAIKMIINHSLKLPSTLDLKRQTRRLHNGLSRSLLSSIQRAAPLLTMIINLGRPQNTSLFTRQNQVYAGVPVQQNFITMPPPDSMLNIDFNAPLEEL